VNLFPKKANYLSSVDTAWLRMEDSTNLMMVTALLLFDEPINFEQLKATTEHRLVRFDRFRQRVQESRLPLRNPQFVDDPTFDLNAHIHRVALPEPGDEGALQRMVSDLMSTPLDYSKPLWQLHVIENYGRGCAVCVRLHHCIGDGIALAYVLLSITDARADAPWPTPIRDEEPRPDGLSLASLLGRASAVAKEGGELAEKLVEESKELIFDPAKSIALARGATATAAAAARLTFRWPDPKTLFKGKLGVQKRAAWSPPLPLRDVKAVRKVTGGTVNDVLLTAVTGALRRYMEWRGEPVDGVDFRAVVPVNLRPLEEMAQLGNRFGLVFLSLPVGIADPLERLHELKERMDGLKNTPEAIAAFGILTAVGMTPADIQEMVVKLFGTKATAVMTNVPGPQMTLYLAGQPITGIMFWVPQSGRLGLGVSILSYAGQVRLGVATDAGLVPDPERIIVEFQREFDELMELVRIVQADEARAAAIPAPPEPAPAPVAGPTANGHSQPIAAEPGQHRCQAISKKSGRQCKNMARAGSLYCASHQPQAEELPAV
jgi:WS/DGAT/MGAT family acyltransferase